MLSTAIMLNAHTVKIQTSKTCEHVELDDLKDDVKRSVLAAALDNGDPCSLRNNIGGEKGKASGQVGVVNIEMENTGSVVMIHIGKISHGTPTISVTLAR